MDDKATTTTLIVTNILLAATVIYLIYQINDLDNKISPITDQIKKLLNIQ